MIKDLRQQYNSEYTQVKYQTLLDDIQATFNDLPHFKVAETPVFIPKTLKKQLFQACEEIVDTIVAPNFKERSQSALLAGQTMPSETEHTTFLQMDFGICIDENGNYSPQLIEVQGFPSLYFYQELIANLYKKHFDIPENYTHLFGGISSEGYMQKLRDIIIGDCDPENVILLEIEPDKQTTHIDFVICKKWLNIPYVCVSELKKEGKDVFYYNEEGRKIQVKRIFNRVIFDELIKRDDLKREFYFTEEANVEWIGHPHWFFRISKHTLPLLDSQFVPKSYFLHELEEYPADLHNYVLKPLYSFAGTGVIININKHDLDAITDKENYILQRKVTYAPVVETLNVPAKCEVRMLMLWEKGAARPVMVNNLARLSKGEMIGVRYNKGMDWVGGTVGFYEEG